MSLALVLAQIRAQVGAVTPTRMGDQPFVSHSASGATMDLRAQAAASPIGLHRRFEIRLSPNGMPVDDGEAAVVVRRQRATVLVVVAYEMSLMTDRESAEITLGEDSQSIIDRLWDPNNWDESTSGLMACNPGQPTARGPASADVAFLEIPFTVIYH